MKNLKLMNGILDEYILVQKGNNMITAVKRSALAALSMIILMGSHAAFAGERNGQPPVGPVSDEAAAIKIATTSWERIYGKEKIERQKPYKAVLKDNVWHVSGSLPRGSKGGVAEAEIRKTDGHLIKLWHGK